MLKRLLPSLVCLAVSCSNVSPEGESPGPEQTDAGDVGDATEEDSSPGQCYEPTLQVEVDVDISIEQSCAIWNSLAELAGEATITRAGTALSIQFAGGATFAGTITADDVSLIYTHEHPFSDGCQWQATETMSGTVNAQTCSMNVAYDYVESVVVSNGSCASPCSAEAEVDLTLTPIVVE